MNIHIQKEVVFASSEAAAKAIVLSVYRHKPVFTNSNITLVRYSLEANFPDIVKHTLPLVDKELENLELSLNDLALLQRTNLLF